VPSDVDAAKSTIRRQKAKRLGLSWFGYADLCDTSRSMTYDEFREAWLLALRESRLQIFGVNALEESLALRAMARIGESIVGPYPQADPFTVCAKFQWRWDALNTARTATCEEDLLTELVGRDEAARMRTQRPWLRVDISLHASLPMGSPMPLPSKAKWSNWTSDVMHTLASRTPIVPAETSREDRRGRLAILTYQGEPEAEVRCGRDGELKLAALEVAAWQAIELARKWDDPSRRPDEGVDSQLDQMFARVKAALGAWAELTIHLQDVN
jgi:hypothetical protein